MWKGFLGVKVTQLLGGSALASAGICFRGQSEDAQTSASRFPEGTLWATHDAPGI